MSSAPSINQPEVITAAVTFRSVQFCKHYTKSTWRHYISLWVFCLFFFHCPPSISSTCLRHWDVSCTTTFCSSHVFLSLPVIPSLPKVVKRRVNALKNLQVKCAHIEAKFYEEVHELERKYAALYQPLFDKVCPPKLFFLITIHMLSCCFHSRTDMMHHLLDTSIQNDVLHSECIHIH